jgi:hypothetical protein
MNLSESVLDILAPEIEDERSGDEVSENIKIVYAGMLEFIKYGWGESVLKKMKKSPSMPKIDELTTLD